MTHQTIVISTEEASGLESPVCRCFGKSPYYVVAEVRGNEIIHTKAEINQRFNGHQMGLLNPTCRCRAKVLLAGGMEPRVAAMFQEMGVEVLCDQDGPAGEVLARYLSNRGGFLQKAAMEN